MKYPQMQTNNMKAKGTAKVTYRDMIQAFRGYNHNLRIDDDEFWDTRNVTLDLYPVLSQRKSRAITATSADGGIFASEYGMYIDGRKLYYGGELVTRDLASWLIGTPRQFCQMGAYIVIWPDKIYFNTYNPSEGVKSIDASYTSVGTVTYQLCDIDGELYTAPASRTAPDSPTNGDYWIDTSQNPHVLCRYSGQSMTWATIPTTYVKVSASAIGKDFQPDDVVAFTGSDILEGSLQIYARDDDYIVTTGIIDDALIQYTPLTVERTSPNLDYITEYGNRIWGCSSDNHEIYACKLGDPTNWYAYSGLSSDSYAATIGSSGVFTGAATLGGNVLFFKEDKIHKVYGSQPSNYQIIETAARGVQEGSWRSLATVNEVLYYLSREGVCAYDGSLPVNISKQFGSEKYRYGVAGGVGNKYYISMTSKDGVWHMFVYDTLKGAWVQEDNTHAEMFATWKDELYYVDTDDAVDATHTIVVATSSDDYEDYTEEGPFDWMVESGDIGLQLADQKYVTRIVLRMEISTGGYAELHVSYDGGDYELKERMYSQSLDSVYAAITPRRCDHMRIKLAGHGPFKLYSISKTIEQGSEINGRL